MIHGRKSLDLVRTIVLHYNLWHILDTVSYCFHDCYQAREQEREQRGDLVSQIPTGNGPVISRLEIKKVMTSRVEIENGDERKIVPPIQLR